MSQTVYLLPHQERFLQSPYCFKNIRWHFLLGGYGPVDRDTEFFNGEQWKPIGDYVKGDKVLQYNLDSDTTELVEPEAYYKMPADFLLSLKTERGLDWTLAPEHRQPVWHKFNKQYFDTKTVDELVAKHNSDIVVPMAWNGYKQQEWHFNEWETRLLIACSADGHYDTLNTNHCRIKISKKRKIERLEWLLSKCSIKYTIGKPDKDGSVPYYFQAPAKVKIFSSDWFNCPSDLFCDEILKWDGCEAEKEYYTNNKSNADMVQFHFTNTGHKSSIVFNKNKKLYTVYRCDRSRFAAFIPDGREPKIVPTVDGYKYCFTVPSSYLVVRKNNKIFVTGNCGKTRSLVMFTMYLVQRLQGVKDDGGSYAKLLVGGYTYAHLEQTFMIDLNSYLDQSKTLYRYDTKNHIMYIGTVQIIFVQLSEPDRIFGQSTYAALLDEADELPEDVMIEAMKSVSQRCRQKLKGERSCFIAAASTAQGYKGFYRLYTHYKKQKISFVLIRALTRDNIYLPMEYIEDLEKSFTETERKVYMEGEFLSVSQGRVIPGFDWERNFEDDDMDLKVPPKAKLFIGQDFNCLSGDTLIITKRGYVPLRDVTTTDYVLTRKGFKKVLTKASRGVKIVHDFNGLRGTDEHTAITPQGDRTLWEAQNFYCLKELSTRELNRLKLAAETVEQWKQLCMMVSSGRDMLVQEHQETNTLCQEKNSSTDIYMKSSTALLRKVIKSTIRMDSMITDLNILKNCLSKSTAANIVKKLKYLLEKECGKTMPRALNSIIHLLKVKRNTRKYLKQLGLKDVTTVSLLVLIVVKSLKQVLKQHNAALRAGLKDASSRKEILTGEASKEIQFAELLKNNVSSVVLQLQELLQQNIAQNISVIGKDQGTSEASEEVFDIEVEDCHEFFADGILVHNCGYSRASVWYSDSETATMHCIKRYDFPDVMEAPNVFRYDFPTQDLYWIPDVTEKDSFPQFAKALRQHNIHIIYRRKSPMVEDSCFLISSLCYQGKIIVHSAASAIAEAFAQASRDKNNKIPKGVGENSPIHDIDGARYATSYMALVLPEYKDVRRSLMTHLPTYRNIIENDNEDDSVKNVGAGYTQIEGRAYLGR